MAVTVKDIATSIRESGYRLTPQRQAILEIIVESHDHLTPGALYKRVRKHHPEVRQVTIYRTLDLLIQLGFLCKVHSEAFCRSYLMKRSDEHHHHLVCSICGKVVDFINCDLGQIEHQLTNDTDFIIDGHLLEFHGRCLGCLNKTSI